MNADVFYDSSIVKDILEGSGSKIACDRSQFLGESMKITVSDKGNINHISKKISEPDHYAVSIDVYRLSPEASEKLFAEIEDTIVNRGDENSWTELALDSIFDMTDFTPMVINGRWFEIDTLDDLHSAEKLFATE